jgi:hypothetical protein
MHFECDLCVKNSNFIVQIFVPVILACGSYILYEVRVVLYIYSVIVSL